MLESLVSLVNFIKVTLYFGFFLSYKAGYLLVASINSILGYFAVILDSLFSFFSALGESSVIFFQDGFQIVEQILLWSSTTVEVISSSVATVFLKLYLFTLNVLLLPSSIYNGLINGLAAIYAYMGQLMAIIKNLVILFGSGVWFLITFIPFLLYYLCCLWISFVHGLYQDICGICYSGLVNAKMLIKDTVLFIFDVPFESIFGLVIFLSLVYILSQFYILIISYSKQTLRKGKMWIRRHWQSREPVHDQQFLLVRQPIPLMLTRLRARKIKEKESIWDEKLCVICQERNKCVLLLPCKHLCLCSECIEELRYYNELCPICRTDIESTMKIFV